MVRVGNQANLVLPWDDIRLGSKGFDVSKNVPFPVEVTRAREAAIVSQLFS